MSMEVALLESLVILLVLWLFVWLAERIKK